jgi:threonyl-tRNA synthetase
MPATEEVGLGACRPHPGMARDPGTAPDAKESYMLMHPVYTKASRRQQRALPPHSPALTGRSKARPLTPRPSAPALPQEYVESVRPRHNKPVTFHQKTGYWAVWALRSTFDRITGYSGTMTAGKWLTRMCYLETVAGVPGMVAGGLRHMRSLRTMRRDNGWIHTLLEEAENERMHLLVFLQERSPGPLFRAAVLGGQGVFLTLYTAFYLLSPKHCHAFVSYLEEEAVRTYTRVIDDIDAGKVPEWTAKPAPQIAIDYWRLEAGATMRDMFLAVRADEACHAHVNGVFADLKADDPNPFSTGTHLVA